ncbi:hypothetical protein D3C73_1511290 [compost metagenome]
MLSSVSFRAASSLSTLEILPLTKSLATPLNRKSSCESIIPLFRYPPSLSMLAPKFSPISLKEGSSSVSRFLKAIHVVLSTCLTVSTRK